MTKFLLLVIAWGLALLLSFLFRIWGEAHPEPFLARPLLIVLLLFTPSIALGIWIYLTGSKAVNSGDEKLPNGSE